MQTCLKKYIEIMKKLQSSIILLTRVNLAQLLILLFIRQNNFFPIKQEKIDLYQKIYELIGLTKVGSQILKVMKKLKIRIKKQRFLLSESLKLKLVEKF